MTTPHQRVIGFYPDNAGRDAIRRYCTDHGYELVSLHHGRLDRAALQAALRTVWDELPSCDIVAADFHTHLSLATSQALRALPLLTGHPLTHIDLNGRPV